MRMKKLIAGIVAGCLTLTSVAVTNIPVNAANATEFGCPDDEEWAQGDFVSNSSPEIEGVDLAGVNKVVFYATANDLNWGWNYGEFYGQSKSTEWTTVSYGGTEKTADITLENIGAFSAELSIDITGESGDYWSVGWATGCSVGAFELNTIKFYKDDDFICAWTNGTVETIDVPTENTPFGCPDDEEWAQGDFISNSSPEMEEVDLAGVDKVVFNAIAIDLNWGWNYGEFYGQSKSTEWTTVSYGGTEKTADITLENTGAFSAELSIDITGESGDYWSVGWATGCSEGCFELKSIEFFKGDKLVCTWISGVVIVEEEPIEYVVIYEDSGTNKECEANSYGSIELSQYATAVYQYPGTYEFSADDKITATVTAPDGVDTSSWTVAFCGLGTWESVNGSAGNLSFTSTIGKIMKANNVEDVADFNGFALQVWNVGEEGAKAIASYDVTISRPKTPAEDITLNKTAITLEKDDTFTLEATVDPANSTDKVVWSSKDKTVATVEDGVVTAVGAGTTTITATAGDASAECVVTVTSAATDIKLNKTEITLEIGKTETLKATVLPADCTDEIVWESSNNKIASVKDGVVTAEGAGTATITATAGDFSAECEVTVTVPAAAVTLNKITLALEKGETFTLEASVDPTNSTDKVVWSSSKTTVATVDENGKVTAVASGEAIITATAGKATATCKVTVTTPVEEVTLSQDSLFLKVDETATLTATVKPADADEKTVTWESDDENVATVKNGVVTAVGKGKANITAKVGGKSAVCEVIVVDPAKEITVENITVLVGEEKTVVIKVDPEGAEISNKTYTSSDPKIFTVTEDGKIKGVSAGKATLTVTAANQGQQKLTAECTVTVTDKAVAATDITISDTDVELEVDGTKTLTATLTPADSTDKITWSSSDETIVSVDETGKITALKIGEATITAKANETTFAECKVTVIAKTIAVETITLDKTAAELNKGDTLELTATVKPDDATNKTVTWTSSDEKVATVDENGKVTAVGAGKAVITAKADGKSASCEITVTVPVTSVTLDKTELSLEKDETDVLTAVVSPEDAADKTVTWTSSNAAVATVDQNGKVTAVGAGTAVITAISNADETIKATCKVTVTVSVASVTLNKTELSLEKDESEVLTAVVAPEDAADKTVTWTSSDDSVATVDQNGKVTAVGAGTAVITAVSNADNTKKAACTVTVTEPEESTEPEVTEPDVTEPDETEPDVTEPDVTEPDVTEPDVTEPDVPEPDVTEPDVTEPDVTEPDVTEPDVTEPDVTSPEEPAVIEGSASGETEVEKDTEIKIVIPELNVTLEAKAETFEEAVSQIIAEVEVKLATATEEEKAAVIAAAIKGLEASADAVFVNEVISVTLKDQDGNIVQPVEGASVKVTLPYDGKSNYVAYIGENAVEFIKLTIADGYASFEAKHFSDYYLVSLSDDAVKAVEGEEDPADTAAATTEPDNTNDGKGDEPNKPTGIAIAIVPMIASAAAAVNFKKRK